MKFDTPLTAKDVEDHREHCEMGAGIARYSKKQAGFTLVRHLNHDVMLDAYEKNYHDSPFCLFHSRLPSAGTVNQNNVQPFANDKILFCHNGTIRTETLRYALSVAGVAWTRDDSDSLLLFKILRRCPINTAVELLKAHDQNFILASAELKRVWIIGRFDLTFDKERRRILMAKNSYSYSTRYIETNFDGFITQFERESSGRPTWWESNKPSCSTETRKNPENRKKDDGNETIGFAY